MKYAINDTGINTNHLMRPYANMQRIEICQWAHRAHDGKQALQDIIQK